MRPPTGRRSWAPDSLRHRLRQQRLAGARRPVQEDPLRHLGAERVEGLRFAQELDDLLQLRAGVVDAGDVGEGDGCVGGGLDLLRLDPRHHFQGPHHHHDDRGEEHDHQDRLPVVREVLDLLADGLVGHGGNGQGVVRGRAERRGDACVGGVEAGGKGRPLDAPLGPAAAKAWCSAALRDRPSAPTCELIESSIRSAPSLASEQSSPRLSAIASQATKRSARGGPPGPAQGHARPRGNVAEGRAPGPAAQPSRRRARSSNRPAARSRSRMSMRSSAPWISGAESSRVWWRWGMKP